MLPDEFNKTQLKNIWNKVHENKIVLGKKLSNNLNPDKELQKAEELGIPVLDEAGFKSLLEKGKG